MRIGLQAIGIGPGALPAVLLATARAAEAAGFATLWVGEHVVPFDRHGSRYPYAESGRFPVRGDVDWLPSKPCVGCGARTSRRSPGSSCASRACARRRSRPRDASPCCRAARATPRSRARPRTATAGTGSTRAPAKRRSASACSASGSVRGREAQPFEIVVAPFTKPAAADDLRAYRDAVVDELVVVDTPPPDETKVAAWVQALAQRWVVPAAALG